MSRAPGHRRIATRLVQAPVRLYRAVPRRTPSPCRFEPSCSTYALDAFDLHGPIRGLMLTLRRISRCHPWGGAGYDPVPAAPAARGNA